jgi:hypothetical protein
MISSACCHDTVGSEHKQLHNLPHETFRIGDMGTSTATDDHCRTSRMLTNLAQQRNYLKLTYNHLSDKFHNENMDMANEAHGDPGRQRTTMLACVNL